MQEVLEVGVWDWGGGGGGGERYSGKMWNWLQNCICKNMVQGREGESGF